MTDRQILGILLALIVPGVAYVAVNAGVNVEVTIGLTLVGIVIALVLQVTGRSKK